MLQWQLSSLKRYSASLQRYSAKSALQRYSAKSVLQCYSAKSPATALQRYSTKL